jgi:hypothetical protein
MHSTSFNLLYECTVHALRNGKRKSIVSRLVWFECSHHQHHQITRLSHSSTAIGPAPHRGGRKREHRSIVLATITHIPVLGLVLERIPIGRRIALYYHIVLASQPVSAMLHCSTSLLLVCA